MTDKKSHTENPVKDLLKSAESLVKEVVIPSNAEKLGEPISDKDVKGEEKKNLVKSATANADVDTGKVIEPIAQKVSLPIPSSASTIKVPMKVEVPLKPLIPNPVDPLSKSGEILDILKLKGMDSMQANQALEMIMNVLTIVKEN